MIPLRSHDEDDAAFWLGLVVIVPQVYLKIEAEAAWKKAAGCTTV
jgi:hypothetical protein